MRNILYLLFICFLFLNCNAQTEKEKPIKVRSDREYDSIDKARYIKAKKYEDSLIAVMQWKPLKDGWLSVSKFGDIGFKSFYHITALETVDTYQTFFYDEKKTAFRTVIDTATFKNISPLSGFGCYFKDKNHIYHYWGNSGGGRFYILDEADYKTFKIIGDGCYAIDKNNVYDIRFGKIDDADAKTFVLINEENCIAKDKNGYFRGNELMKAESLEHDPETRAIIDKDKKSRKVSE